MATIVLPRNLIALFPGAERRAEIDGATVAALLEALNGRWPGMRDRLRDDIGLRPHINVFVDAQPAALDTPVGVASVVHVIPAISGG